jgi:hypothetical protein
MDKCIWAYFDKDIEWTNQRHLIAHCQWGVRLLQSVLNALRVTGGGWVIGRIQPYAMLG